MKKTLLVLVLTVGTLVSKAQSFTFISTTEVEYAGTIKVSGEVIINDSSITQTVNGITSTLPLVMIEGTNKMYKSKVGDWDTRYTFVRINEDFKSKDKKGRYIIKEEETATHILIMENIDRFTNKSMNITMYLTPKTK